MTPHAAALEATPATARPDLAAVKLKQQAAWIAGDYSRVGITLQIVGESLCEAADVRAGERVLDVAAGNGNATLAAARRFASVVSTDYVEPLLARGRARAEAESLPVEFRLADAESLPFEDASFDVVLSTFGVMFVTDPDRAAAELLRVCRPGGRIAMANWTPEGFIGRLFSVIGRHLPPAPGVRPPSLWGTEKRLREMFGAGAAGIEITERDFVFRYRSAEHWLDFFKTHYGPVQKALEALPEASRPQLENDILDLLNELNRDRDTLVIPASYLEVVITRSGATPR